MELWNALVDAAFPTWCPGCGHRGSPLCAPCALTLRPAVAVPPPAGVDRWVSPFAYEGVTREVIARLKYRHGRAAVPWLAARMTDALAYAGKVADPVLVTFAPTTSARRRERGFDPAELLARALARRLELPVRPTLRRLPGPPQTGRPAAERRAGPRFEPRSPLTVATVLIVDDVATTGATISAASAALRSCGAGTVIAVTGARTPPPGSAANGGAYTRSMAAGERR